MTTFGSSDVTVTLTHRKYRAGGGGHWMSAGLITFGDGSLTYALGGVPMPAASAFGFRSSIDFMHVDGPEYQGGVTTVPTAMYKPNWQLAANKMQLMQVGATAVAFTEMAASVAPTVASYRFIAYGK